ncbi:hypothetical protein D910_00461 [Dendroctonus ponderosae]|uniref:Reverse transcriptase domain-containing protein n=1 Tax=Dendroctonus ponderosae TaxID=77166 RepID=U4UZM3_DENPD|nr:hypothetical protein D910_00461 [Dendroctonus ponderosae]
MSKEATVIRDCDVFSEKEVLEACMKIKLQKAPGPDNIPSVITKTVIQTNIPLFVRFYNTFLLCQNFSEEWKKTKLTLIEKPKKSPDDPIKHRPICLIDEIGKVYERLINQRLLTEIQEKKNGFHQNQYGFRKGRSTTHAIKAIQDLVQLYKGMHCAMILLDVKNAFNTASWPVIMEQLEKAEISAYLRNILQSYMTNRTIVLARNSEEDIFGGVPQGSVLGPTLWNILYDDVMRLPMPSNVKVICYADDLALFVASQTPKGMIARANYALNLVSDWMEEHDLQIAPEKTEAILLSYKRDVEDISFLVQDQEVKPQKTC